MPELKKPVGRPKSEEKRSQIILNAGLLILQSGYSNTSMETIAKASNVSKQTLYSHFANKEEILRAVLNNKIDQYQLDKSMFSNGEISLQQGLTMIAEHFIRLLHDDQVVAMHRVIAGELSVSPEVAAIFYELGPKAIHSSVNDFIKCQVKGSNEHINEEQLEGLSKHHTSIFLNMLKGSYHLESLLGLEFALTEAEQTQHAKQCVGHSLMLLKHDLGIE